MIKGTHINLKDEIVIPLSELIFQFSTSGGPGGQHANRSATRVSLLFDVANSPSLNENSRALIQQRLAHRLDKEGKLHINVRDSRSQKRNREIATARLVRLLIDALEEPQERIKTNPSPTKIEERRSEKKKRSRRKRERGKDWSNDF